MAVKAFVGVVGTAFLGAIGSGLWERVLAPLVDWSVGALGASSGRLSSWYLDHLYSEVGRGLHEHASSTPAIVLDTTIVLFSLAGLLLGWRLLAWLKSNDSSMPVFTMLPRPRASRGLIWVAIVLSISNAVLYADDLFKMTYQQGVVIWIERSLEIVRPRIDEQQFHELRAVYRSVENAEDFFRLWELLKATAAAKSVKLPPFDPIGGA